MKKKIKHQPALRDERGRRMPREYSYSTLHPDIKKEIESVARIYGVSKSWVVALALSDHFGIDIESYITGNKKIKLVKGNRR